MKLEYFDLISPEPIPYPGVGGLRSPSLGEVAKLGIAQYYAYVYVFSLDMERVCEELGLLIPAESGIGLFDLLISAEENRTLITDALTFFLCGTANFDRTIAGFRMMEGARELGQVTRENYPEVAAAILEANHVISGLPSGKPKNKRAAKIAEKLRKAKKAQQNAGSSRDNDLGNILSALCVQHNSYNLTNVWSLTIYQLYDQFLRQSYKCQNDIASMRWSAWGQEPFDMSQWFKSFK